MKVTVTRVSVTDKSRDGSPIIGKYGPQIRVGLQVKEHGEKWLSGFMKPDKRDHFQVGKEYELEIEQKGDFLNFRLPKASANPELEQRVRQSYNDIQNIIVRLVRIEKQIGINPQDAAFPPKPSYDSDKALEEMDW